ncbi:MAG: hypothetical protein LQ351_002633 [Letrouitia transgressa]|nr:MAG: hypothetical protein LQ351_002633 [Letrouitia transgressa]
MEDEEDDDIYAPEEPKDGLAVDASKSANPNLELKKEDRKPGDLEEGEQEDEEDEEEESDSDVDIITERKDGPKSELSAQPSRISAIKVPPARTPSASTEVGSRSFRSSAVKGESTGKTTPTPTKSGALYPPVKTSTINLDAKPIYGPNGKPITEIDMDTDFSEDEKPWRRPGTDMTDFFNYGFDEFTWATYCLKQDSIRKDISDTKKQMEDMQSFMSIPGGMPPMPGIPAASSGGQSGMSTMPGMEGFPPELQQMMQQMMAQGMDPTQVSPEMMMQMMAGQTGGNAGQAQNFGGAQGFSQQGQNQGAFGYGSGGAGGGGGSGGRSQGGRGQGRRW